MLNPTSPKAHGAHSTAFNPSTQRQSASSMNLQTRRLDNAALSAITSAISMSNAYEDDFVNLAEVGDKLPRMSPDLVPRNYGFERLREFVLASGVVELRMKPMGNHPPIALVRLKSTTNNASGS